MIFEVLTERMLAKERKSNLYFSNCRSLEVLQFFLRESEEALKFNNMSCTMRRNVDNLIESALKVGENHGGIISDNRFSNIVLAIYPVVAGNNITMMFYDMIVRKNLRKDREDIYKKLLKNQNLLMKALTKNVENKDRRRYLEGLNIIIDACIIDLEHDIELLNKR